MMTRALPVLFCLALSAASLRAAEPAAVLPSAVRPAVQGTAPPAGAAAAPVAEVKSSTPPITVASIYTVEKLRDPFQRGGASTAAGSSKEFVLEDFSIHNLSLKGLLKDSGTDYALLVDREFGLSFVLRKGRLYDQKNKPVPGITGTIDIRQKQVNVMTMDKDVQVLRLGEEEPAE